MCKKIIYIAGPDGSGKTSFLKAIEGEFNKNGLITHQVWLRSPKIFSKPLMLYCRIVGLTKYSIKEGIRYGSHEFYRSRSVSWLFPILQLIDFKLKWIITKLIINNNDILLLDRFALDTLSDLMVDTHRFDLHKNWVGKAFIKLLPANTNILVLSVLETTIRARKADTLFDPNITYRIKSFDVLSKDLKLNVINNNRPYNIVKKEIYNIIGLNEGD